MTSPDPDILTHEEAAAYLRIHVMTLYSLARRGRIPGAKVGGRWRYRRSYLQAFLNGRPLTLRAGPQSESAILRQSAIPVAATVGPAEPSGVGNRG